MLNLTGRKLKVKIKLQRDGKFYPGNFQNRKKMDVKQFRKNRFDFVAVTKINDARG